MLDIAQALRNRIDVAVFLIENLRQNFQRSQPPRNVERFSISRLVGRYFFGVPVIVFAVIIVIKIVVSLILPPPCLHCIHPIIELRRNDDAIGTGIRGLCTLYFFEFL